jgi:HEAT repeat protein
MTTYFCPACWTRVGADDISCPRCRGDLARLDQRSFEEKLIAALRHPEPTTRHRAAFILGELGTAAAVKVFAELLFETAEPFFASAMVVALGKIGGLDAERVLLRTLDHESFLVRQAAVQALIRCGGPIAEVALQHAACDRSPSVRRIAREILAREGHEC